VDDGQRDVGVEMSPFSQDIFIEPGGDWLKVNENVGFAFGRSNPADESQDEIPTPLVPLPGGGGKAKKVDFIKGAIVWPEELEIPESWRKPVGNERLDGVVGIMSIIPSTERKS
jgi:hypothetical protein